MLSGCLCCFYLSFSFDGLSGDATVPDLAGASVNGILVPVPPCGRRRQVITGVSVILSAVGRVLQTMWAVHFYSTFNNVNVSCFRCSRVRCHL